MRIDMNVPYQDKDEAKELGARWDGLKRCWYIVDKEDLTPFMKWFPEYLTKPYNNNPGQGKKRKKKKKSLSEYAMNEMRKQSVKHFKTI
jgi:hypothetical protein